MEIQKHKKAKNRVARVLACFVIVLMVISCATIQKEKQYGYLTGKIYSNYIDRPVPSGYIYIEELDIRIVCDGEKGYRCRLPVGVYNIEAGSYNHTEAFAKLRVQSGMEIEHDFYLDALKGSTLD